MFGIIADRYGRIPALIITNMFGLVGGIATAFSYNFVSFAIARFVIGFAFDNCFTMMYILGEWIPDANAPLMSELYSTYSFSLLA